MKLHAKVALNRKLILFPLVILVLFNFRSNHNRHYVALKQTITCQIVPIHVVFRLIFRVLPVTLTENSIKKNILKESFLETSDDDYTFNIFYLPLQTRLCNRRVSIIIET